ALDKIAIVVGVNNPFNGGLTSDQVRGIFQGQITNWSQVGGPNSLIRVINRPTVSGTHQAFKEMVLDGGNFGSSSNITTMERDATTPMLRVLGDDGIGYATYAQVANQQTVRSLPIDGSLPNSATYPLSRQLFYVYKNPPTQGVRDFLGYATSPQGQQGIFAD
ncbi:MAG: phosphate ABC transporter substrate-binding protein, partial [Okeania sp. SIO2H7]|nr:phosphate ABC transporter substrate-binding protein [Okeania sp. SIO2H7]